MQGGVAGDGVRAAFGGMVRVRVRDDCCGGHWGDIVVSGDGGSDSGWPLGVGGFRDHATELVDFEGLLAVRLLEIGGFADSF